jgi:hypothetical protein
MSPKARPSLITKPADAPFAHEQIGAEPDDGDGDLGRRILHE